jgi:hypothetical protein
MEWPDSGSVWLLLVADDDNHFLPGRGWQINTYCGAKEDALYFVPNNSFKEAIIICAICPEPPDADWRPENRSELCEEK